MTEPVTNADNEAVVRQRFDCAHVGVTQWQDTFGREWIACSLTWDAQPHTGTTWSMLGPCETREALLREVRQVVL
jgi:hypothetical protein